MESITNFLEVKLKLKIYRTKSVVKRSGKESF